VFVRISFHVPLSYLVLVIDVSVVSLISFSSRSSFFRVLFHCISSPILANGSIFLFVFRRLNSSIFASCRILCLSVLYCICIYPCHYSLLSICFHIFPVLIFFGGIPSMAAFVCFCMMNFHAIICSSACPLLIAFPSFFIPKYIHFLE